MRSVQFTPHTRRSDGHETAFVGVGLVPGRFGIVVARVRISAGIVVDTEISAGIEEVTSGVRVAVDVTAGAAE